MKTLAWLGAAGAAVTLAACADEHYASNPPPGAAAAAPAYAGPASAVAPACFYTKDIRNHTVGDEHTLYLNVNGRQFYRVEMSGACLAGATTSDPIVIRNPPGTNNVCRPIDMDISVSMGGGSLNRCIVSGLTPMTPAEVAALPPKIRP